MLVLARLTTKRSGLRQSGLTWSMALRGAPFERTRQSCRWDRQARHASMGLHKMGFLHTVIDGGVQVLKCSLE